MALWLLSAPAAAVSAPADVPQGDVPFERRGIVTPFRRDQKQDFANDNGVALIESNVAQILGMRCETPTSAGELPFDPGIGSLLPLLRHQNVTAVLRHQAEIYVVDALARWEPRVEVRSVVTEVSNRAITVRTRYDIIDRYGRGQVLASDLENVTTIDREAA